uniref:BPTI/Kunitz inhibitor domain-containing protein n=1 Tax=Acanthochromis polyacanthus TaxID=80966 RepID=A0A3Q1GZ22_9TELE
MVTITKRRTKIQDVVPLDPRCNLSLDQGTCRDYSIRWYYDKQANSCAQFWYGGCGGNDNRYETEDECKKTCVLYRTGNPCCFYVHILFDDLF